MKTFSIYGCSDDLVEAEGIKGCDEFNVIEDDGLVKASFKIVYKKSALRIRVLYDGCWSFSVGQIDDLDFPDWKIKTIPSPNCTYSMQIEIEVPDSAKLIRERE
jgi:hypothetical protein